MKSIKDSFRSFLKIEERARNLSHEIIARNNFIPINNTKEEDIFITGFPKSGNTWMQNLISGLLYGLDTSLLPDTLTQELVPDIYGKTYYKRFHSVNFFKSHELPKPHMKRVIYLVRDGRDAMASYYAMNRALGKNVTLKEMIVDGKEIYPSKWYVHIREWLKNPYNSNILVVKYEDLISEPYKQLERILGFSKLDRSPEILKRTIEGNSFENMKMKEEKFGWNNDKWDPNERCIRRGKIGSYKEEISKNLIDYLEKEAFKELKEFNYL